MRIEVTQHGTRGLEIRYNPLYGVCLPAIACFAKIIVVDNTAVKGKGVTYPDSLCRLATMAVTVCLPRSVGSTLRSLLAKKLGFTTPAVMASPGSSQRSWASCALRMFHSLRTAMLGIGPKYCPLRRRVRQVFLKTAKKQTAVE